MKSRPILFSAPMVRALLDGRKSQTRRVVKPQPEWNVLRQEWQWSHRGALATWSGDKPQAAALLGLREHCPYGAPGDRLWVRETWARDDAHDRTFYRADADQSGAVPYEMKGEGGWGGGVGHFKPRRWRPSIHMPRKSSRILLEVTDVRVERLQGISDADAFAEGVERCGHDGYHTDQGRCAFRTLWESIHGAESWAANPWLWVVGFQRVTP